MVCLGGVWPEFRVSLRVGSVVRVWGFCGQRQRPGPRRLSALQYGWSGGWGKGGGEQSQQGEDGEPVV